MKCKLFKMFFSNNKLKYSTIFFLALVYSIIQISISISYIYVTEYVGLNNILFTMIFFILLWVLKFTITFLVKYLGILVDVRSKKNITNYLMNRLYDEDYSSIEFNGHDYYSTIFLRDVERLSSYTSKIFIPTLLGISSFVFAIGIGIYLSPLITTLIIMLTSLSVYIIKLYKSPLTLTEESKMSKQEALNKLLMSLKNNQVTIHITRCEDYMEALITNSWQELKNNEKEYIKMNARSRSTNFGVGLVFNTIWMIIALYMVYLEKLSLGSFLFFMTLSGVYNWPFFELPWIAAEKYSTDNSYKKIFDYSCLCSQVESVIKKEPFESIELIGLKYKYKATENIIKYPYIKINKGDWIAIKGDSGAGKTTLSKILLGLFRADEGIIKINSREISYAPYKCISFGYLSQSISLFLNEELPYNINLDESELSEEQLELINDNMLPIKSIFKKDIREDFDNFSGGELKYLGVLRAISKNPDVIVLDEFSAGLDENNTNRLLDMLKRLNKTLVFISHDEKVIQRCDRCVILNGEYND